jgi:hypothetical protein
MKRKQAPCTNPAVVKTEPATAKRCKLERDGRRSPSNSALIPNLLGVCASYAPTFPSACAILGVEDFDDTDAYVRRFRKWRGTEEKKEECEQTVIRLLSDSQCECDEVGRQVRDDRCLSVLVVAGPGVVSIADNFSSRWLPLQQVEFICPWVAKIGGYVAKRLPFACRRRLYRSRISDFRRRRYHTQPSTNHTHRAGYMM